MKKGILLTVSVCFLLIAGALSAYAAPDAVLSSDNPADHAVAQVLAAHLETQAVTTPWGVLDNESINGLLRLNATKIYIVGGEAAVPQERERLSEKGVSIEKRFSGSDRYETSLRAAGEWENTSSAVIAYGYDVEGIRDAASLAEARGAPILLIHTSHVTPEVLNTLSDLSVTQVTVVPSPNMIQNYIYEDLKSSGFEVEFLWQDHWNKTFNMIEMANQSIMEAETANYTARLDGRSQDMAEALIREAGDGLKRANEAAEGGRFDIAFSEAVFARYRAENSLKIKTGRLRVRAEKERSEKEQTTQIAQILLHPNEYSGKNVTIKAKVEEAVDVAGSAFVKLFDGTGRIIATFPADREYMLSKGFIFMADPGIIGQTVSVNGTVRLNVPLGGGGGDHGAFAYLLEVNTITLAPPE